MKIILKSLIVSATLVMAQIAHSQNFVEGTHYSEINGAKESDTQEVVEYFSFSCPGCYFVEPHIQTLKKNLPLLKVRRVHMPFGGPKAKLSQKAFVTMKTLKAEQHSDAIFSRIHIKKNLFDSDQEIVEFFVSLGYQQKKVAQALNSFTADTLLRTMRQEAIKMQIDSVPTIIVNGRYKINTRLVGSETDLSALIEFLSQLNLNSSL